jgi:hypothetical protein
VNHNTVKALWEAAAQSIDWPSTRKSGGPRIRSYKAAVHIGSHPHGSRVIATQFLAAVHYREIGKRLVEADKQICEVDTVGIDDMSRKSRWREAKHIGILDGIPITRRR